MRIRQTATSYLGSPVTEHHGVVGDDGTATINAKMPSVVQLFAEGRLPPVGGPPVEVAVGVAKLGLMVLREVRCTGQHGWNDVAVLGATAGMVRDRSTRAPWCSGERAALTGRLLARSIANFLDPRTLRDLQRARDRGTLARRA